MRATALAAPAGMIAASMHFGGALKSTPVLGTLGLDLTVAAALALAPLLVLLMAARRWRLQPEIGIPLAACGALWLWMVLAGGWSASLAILATKLPEVVLMGPAMLVAGLLVGGDAATLRRFCAASVAIAVLVSAGLCWGLTTGGVVLGGIPGADSDRLRVSYQATGLAIACGGGLAAVRLAEARAWPGALFWLPVLIALALSALLPGSRQGLAALALVVALAPVVALWSGGRAPTALLWCCGVALLGLGSAVTVQANPELAQGLRTLERLTGGGGPEGSGRLSLWGAALELAGRAAPFGLGPGGFAIAAGFGERRGLYPHNHALEALAEGGLPGLLLWLLAFGGAALAMLRLAPRVAPARAARVVALTLPVAVTIMVSTDLGNRMAWFALGLALSLGFDAEEAPHRV